MPKLVKRETLLSMQPLPDNGTGFGRFLLHSTEGVFFRQTDQPEDVLVLDVHHR